MIEFAIEKNIEIISDIEITQQMYNQAQYIGITGTNGKSTTTSLIGNILMKHSSMETAVCGNIGTPILSIKQSDLYVMELSSYQLDLLKNLSLKIAVCINITPDHLDHYENINDYAASKARIFSENSINIISADYELCEKISSNLKNVIKISREKIVDCGVSIFNHQLFISNCFHFVGTKQYDLPYNESLLGKYNAENVAAAIAACLAMNINIEKILDCIEKFHGLPHRMERVLQKNGITFINDSKATNCASTKSALDALKGQKIHWIAGGVYKDNALEELAEFFPYIEKAYLIGSSTDEFETILTKHGLVTEKCYNLEIALSFIQNLTEGIVLLSPACASTDQWKNFEERGDFFRSFILQNF